MLTQPHTGLSVYFRHSDQFYYILADLEGNILYSNSLFQEHFSHICDKEKYQQTVQDCLKHPMKISGAILKMKKHDNNYAAVQWEFTMYGDEINPGIQGIGIIVNDKSELFNKTSADHKKEIHKQKQLTIAAIEEKEMEKQKIGKELHENINQHLTTTRLYLEVVKDKVAGESFEIINFAHNELSDIINEINYLSQSLVPSALTDVGLIESVKDFVNEVKLNHSITVGIYHKYFDEELLPVNMKLMLLRSIREQINNIIRHAEATIIQVHFQLDAETINVIISDDGKGFNTSAVRRGTGLNNIINGAELFNGKVEIFSASSKGCTVTITLPLTTNLTEL